MHGRAVPVTGHLYPSHFPCFVSGVRVMLASAASQRGGLDRLRLQGSRVVLYDSTILKGFLMGFFSSPQAFSSVDETWRTPRFLFEQLNKEHEFRLDAAALQCSTLVPENWYGPDHPDLLRRDAFVHDWCADAGGGSVFLNPPYGRGIGKWMEKALRTSQSGCVVVCLVPARTDTGWWHDFVIDGNANVTFLRGRLRFNDGPNAAPFPSAVVRFGV